MTLNQLIGLLIILGGCAGLVWVYIRILKQVDDPGLIIFKTVVSIIVVVGFSLYSRYLLGKGVMGLFGVVIGLIGGVVLAVLWRQHITNAIAQPFVNLFTGGSVEPDPEPFYSIARTRRKHGKADEAIALIREQLDEFPNDFNGLMMLAEIQALDQHNLSGAAETVELIFESQMDRPRNVALALNALADWHLQVYRDRDAARACFERIRNTFPKHPVAMEAAQRIAHLPSQEMLNDKVERRAISLKERPQVVIRERSDVVVVVDRESPDDAIARLEGQLELHPLDRESREELAALYAGHSGDLVAAIHQLEFLLNQPQLDKQTKVKLLNRMTDFYVQYGDDVSAAEKPLQRIITTYPESPMADQATRRKMLLKKEFQGKEKNRGIHLGSYEKDLGLR